MFNDAAEALRYGLKVGKFAENTQSPGMGRSEAVRNVRPRRLRIGMLLTAGALLAGIAYGLHENTVQPSDSSGRLQLQTLEQRESARISALHITVPATIVVEPSSQTPLQLSIGPLHELPTKALVLLSGLPPAVSLSAGRALGIGEWVIPLSEQSRLTLNVPGGLSGESEITITLFGGWDGAHTRTVQARTRLVIAAPSATKELVEVALRVPPAKPDQNPSEADSKITPPETGTTLPIAAVARFTGASSTPAPKPDANREEPTSQVPGIAPEERKRAEKIAAHAELDLERKNATTIGNKRVVPGRRTQLVRYWSLWLLPHRRPGCAMTMDGKQTKWKCKAGQKCCYDWLSGEGTCIGALDFCL